MANAKAGLLLIVAWIVTGCSDPTYVYDAHFTNGRGVVPYTKVLMSGITVGHVYEVYNRTQLRDGFPVGVKIALTTTKPLREQARLSIRNRSPIGEVIIRIDPGPPEAVAMPSGSTLTRTRVAVRVEDMGDIMYPIFEKIDLDKVEQAMASVFQLLEIMGNSEEAQQSITTLFSLLDDLNELLSKNNKNIATLSNLGVKMLDQVESADLAEVEPIIANIQEAQRISASIETKIDNIVQQFDQQMPASEIKRTRDSLHNALRAMEELQSLMFVEIIKKIAQTEGATGGLFSRSQQEIINDIDSYQANATTPAPLQ